MPCILFKCIYSISAFKSDVPGLESADAKVRPTTRVFCARRSESVTKSIGQHDKFVRGAKQIVTRSNCRRQQKLTKNENERIECLNDGLVVDEQCSETNDSLW